MKQIMRVPIELQIAVLVYVEVASVILSILVNWFVSTLPSKFCIDFGDLTSVKVLGFLAK